MPKLSRGRPIGAGGVGGVWADLSLGVYRRAPMVGGWQPAIGGHVLSPSNVAARRLRIEKARSIQDDRG